MGVFRRVAHELGGWFTSSAGRSAGVGAPYRGRVGRYAEPMDRREALTRRLHTQLVWAPAPLDPAAVVGRFLAMQAQEYVPSQWAIAQRTRGVLDAASLTAAIDAGAILRTHVLRPTWHYVAPVDARWLLELTGPRVHQVNGAQLRPLGLTPTNLARAGAVIAECVSEGQHRTRAELGVALGAAGLPSSGRGLTYAVMTAEVDRVVISGAARGKQRTYVAFDDRVPPAVSPFDRPTALADLAQRYLLARGPATVRDLALWSGLTLTDARTGVRLAVERAPDDLVEVTVEDAVHWMPRSSYEEVVTAPDRPRADLLQAYDEYVMGYTETRGYFAPPGYRAPTVPTRLPHHLFLDGLLRGSWGHTVTARAVTVTVLPFAELDARERAATEDAAERYAAFHGMPLQVRWEGPGA